MLQTTLKETSYGTDKMLIFFLGLLRETMIHSLRTLRNNNNLLLATMEVFVQEPSMDWLDFARKHDSLNKAVKNGNHLIDFYYLL